MNGFASLSQGDRGKTLQLGEFVTLEILIEGSQGIQEKEITVKDAKERWFSSGSFTIDTQSFRVVPTEGNSTKISVRAMVHQPNDLFLEPIELNTSAGTISVTPAQFSQKAAAPEGIEKEQAQWFLPTQGLGGWNIPALGAVSILVAIVIFLFGRWIYRRLIKERVVDYRTRTMNGLQGLQKFSRGKSGLKQEEWKKFSFELAGIMRRYCDDNFKFDSTDLTDREFLRELRFHAANEMAVDSLGKILSTIDEVRYGRKELDLQVIPHLLLEARRFVEQTYKKEAGGKE